VAEAVVLWKGSGIPLSLPTVAELVITDVVETLLTAKS
jgi:hypothetical protein